MEKIKLKLPVIVEGKYDKITLSSVIEGTVITTDGFGIFNNAEKRALIRKLSENGIIVLCDSDGAGKLIRSHLSGIVEPERLYQLYVPQIKGKERRKSKASAEGYLGVEGMSTQILRNTLERFISIHPETVGGEAAPHERITKTDLYVNGLSGGENSAVLRDSLALHFDLPAGMTANALLSALNIITTREVFNSICGKLKPKEDI